ncbi:6-pyruvoyl-tetrahydropterin synthase-related protein [Sphaerisporangium sp. NBC_01403]|uniref:6-pyruvoyl-tetrahydropterin synthase-related protein n=1 Tax=Sphaerisporangium sp. NBC_01403 TaxID=2903599 RepID=UPI003251A8B4
MRVRGGGYLLLSVIVSAWSVLVAGRHAWTGDWHLHVATVRALAHHPLAPEDPLVGGQVGSPYFTPYTLLLALVSRTTGLTPEAVLSWAGVANAGLLLWGLRVFCRRLGDRTATAVLAVVFVLLLWGTRPFAWSGFPPMASLSFTQPYPSTLALALMPPCWAFMLRFREEGRPSDLVRLAVLAALIVLVHPFTAAETAFVAAAFLLARPRAWTRGRLIALACAGIGALALAALWPYAELSALARAGSGFSRIHSTLVANAFGKYWLVLVGIPALWLGRRLPLGRELAVGFAAGTAVVTVAVLLGRYEFTRLIPVVALMSQLAVARCLGDRLAGWRPYGAVAATACVAGLFGAAPGIARALPPGVPADLVPARATEHWPGGRIDHRAEFARPYVRDGDVVMARRAAATRTLVGWGVRAVAPPYPYPFVADETARRTAQRRMFAGATPPEERLALADRYGVRCLLGRRPPEVPGFVPVAASGRETLLCRPRVVRARAGIFTPSVTPLWRAGSPYSVGGSG